MALLNLLIYGISITLSPEMQHKESQFELTYLELEIDLCIGLNTTSTFAKNTACENCNLINRIFEQQIYKKIHVIYTFNL